MWQQSEPLDDETSRVSEAKHVFDDQVEALAPEPVECFEHGLRSAVHPSLVHVHCHESVQQWAVFVLASASVIGHYVVGCVDAEPLLTSYAPGDSRFA